MGINKEDINAVYAELSAKLGGNRNDYFGAAYLAAEFGIEASSLQENINLEDRSLGIDAFYIDKERGNLYLYQFKWTENYHIFIDSFKRLANNGLETVFTDPKTGQQSSQFLLRLKKSLLENQALIGRVFIYFVYNGSTQQAEKSSVIETLREELEAKKFIVDRFFSENSITFSFQLISNSTSSLSSISHTRQTHRYEIDIENAMQTETKNGEKMYLGLISLMTLHKIYLEMNYRFFERNIRAGLSADKPPNKEIRKSLKNMIIEGTEEVDSFVFNHNGVTISAESLEMTANKAIITEPRLLNGAQSVTSLAVFIKKYEKNRKFQKNKEKLDNIKVVVKIITNANNDFITNVTVCNNRQNPVDAWNLRSNDLMQLQIQDKFREDLKIYYERQENSFEDLTESDIEDLGVNQQKTIEVKRLAQTLLALQGQVDRMSRLREVFSNTKVYNNTFKSSYLKKDFKQILLFYKVQFRLGRIIKEFELENADRFYFLRGGKNLLWALLLQAILNENNNDELTIISDNYGCSLSIESGFTDFLKDLAIKKLKPILSAAIREYSYSENIKEEKYGFVRTKKFYSLCMNMAAERFGWQKKSL